METENILVSPENTFSLMNVRASSERNALSRQTANSFSTFELLSVVFVLIIGSCLQCVANKTIDAILVMVIVCLIGIAVIRIFFRKKTLELRAFLLTFGVCIFVGGLGQLYSLLVFGKLQGTIDALYYFRLISPEPPFLTLENMPKVNSVLSMIIWQQAYKIAWWFGFSFGPYIGVMINAMIMGITASITVRIAREIYGENIRKLRLVGTLFAFCGMFVLFGSVLIRDCFTTLVQSLLLLGITQWLIKPKLRRFIAALIISSICIYAMFFLRVQAVNIILIHLLLAFFVWYVSSGMTAMRIGFSLLLVVLLFFVVPEIGVYINRIEQIQKEGLENYAVLTAKTHTTSSLGMQYVVNQSIPIRLITGGVSLLIRPVPLWIKFNMESSEYDWIHGYHGLFLIFLLPLICTAFSIIVHMFFHNKPSSSVYIFLAGYILCAIVGVVLTSLESRHLGQFLPAAIVLAALPDVRNNNVKKRLHLFYYLLITAVVCIHLGWVVLKSMQ